MITSNQFASSTDSNFAILKILESLEQKRPYLIKDPLATTALKNLYADTLKMCQATPNAQQETIRTIHHLSCTGGTLISKCIAAMPNTRVLNEVDPLSNLFDDLETPPFTPTDLTSLVRQADHQTDEDLLLELFLNNLKVLVTYWNRIGLRTVLREHSHGRFLTEASELGRKSIRDFISDQFKLNSIVTARDPIDSFLSLKKNGWIDFEPGGFDEYCRRYMIFLNAHEGIEVFKYEDLIQDPVKEIQRMCHSLELNFSSSFTDTFSFFCFSGDSGRKGSKIEHRTRRPIDNQTYKEIISSANYITLADRLGYGKLNEHI